MSLTRPFTRALTRPLMRGLLGQVGGGGGDPLNGALGYWKIGPSSEPPQNVFTDPLGTIPATTAGDLIASWRDPQSGNLATQATEGLRPSLGDDGANWYLDRSGGKWMECDLGQDIDGEGWMWTVTRPNTVLGEFPVVLSMGTGSPSIGVRGPNSGDLGLITPGVSFPETWQAAPLGEAHVIGTTWTRRYSRFFVDGIERASGTIPMALYPNGGFTGEGQIFYIGTDGSGNSSDHRTYEVAVGSIFLNPTQTNAANLFFGGRFGILITPPFSPTINDRIVAGIDSITDGYSVRQEATWLNLFRDNRGASTVNLAHSGATTSYPLDYTQEYIEAVSGYSGRKVLIYFGGTNSIAAGVSPAAVLSQIDEFLTDVSPAYDDIFVIPMLPRTGFESQRSDLNDGLLSAYGAKLIRVDLDPDIGVDGANEDTDYYLSDSIHLNLTGQQKLHELVDGEIYPP